MSAWGVSLNGVYLSGGADDDNLDSCAPQIVAGCLTTPPDGLGPPALRTEDVVYAQRDGSRHYNDWYESRIITLDRVIVSDNGCCGGEGDCSAREKLRDLIQAWKRQCDDVELVIYPPCPTGSTPEERSITGPFGVVGRPRVASYSWIGQDRNIAAVLLRFDAIDQRMYILDECGTPGYGESVVLSPRTRQPCRIFSKCFGASGMCYDQPGEGTLVDPTEINVSGTECTYPTITLGPNLTWPRVENLDTGDYYVYRDIITTSPVIIDTEEGVATQDGVSVTHLLTGSAQFRFSPGTHTLRALSQDTDDNGTVTVAWRDTVLNG